MKCSSCDKELSIFRVVGVCDFNNFIADEIAKSNANIPLLIGANFVPVAMLVCDCGNVSFITVQNAISSGLRQDGHARGEVVMPLPTVDSHGE